VYGSGREKEAGPSGPGGFSQWARWEARPNKVKKRIFQFLFSNKFQTTTSNQFLSKKMAFSRNGPKRKVA
jgi:hypothetical protein